MHKQHDGKGGRLVRVARLEMVRDGRATVAGGGDDRIQCGRRGTRRGGRLRRCGRLDPVLEERKKVGRTVAVSGMARSPARDWGGQ